MSAENSSLSDKDLQSLRLSGYCIIENVLSSSDLETLSELSSIEARRDTEDGAAWRSNGNQKVFMLINRHPAFLGLIDHQIALDLATALLGRDFLLSSIVANFALPGNSRQQVHADQEYADACWGRPVAMNVVWAISDFSAQSGGTVVYPETHLLGRRPDGSDRESLSINAPAGSAIALDGRLWHCAGKNESSTARLGILSHYCEPYLRQQENFARSVNAEVRRSLNVTQRRLLGFDVWRGLGGVNGLPASWARKSERTGPINSDHIF